MDPRIGLDVVTERNIALTPDDPGVVRRVEFGRLQWAGTLCERMRIHSESWWKMAVCRTRCRLEDSTALREGPGRLGVARTVRRNATLINEQSCYGTVSRLVSAFRYAISTF